MTRRYGPRRPPTRFARDRMLRLRLLAAAGAGRPALFDLLVQPRLLRASASCDGHLYGSLVDILNRAAPLHAAWRSA